MTNGAQTLSVLSWNVHRSRGSDGLVDPDRTLVALTDEAWRPDVRGLVLQEADAEIPPHAGILDIARVEAATGLRSVHVERSRRWGQESHGFLGTILFLHPSIEVEEVVLLDLPGRCHRGAVVLDGRWDGRAFRLVGTHLSLLQALRIAQMRTLGQHLFRRPARQTILCGDLNEWRPWGGLALSKRILGMRFSGPAPATFPIRRPFLPLDRILTTEPGRVVRAEVRDGDGIRMASDHRPLLADVLLPRTG